MAKKKIIVPVKKINYQPRPLWRNVLHPALDRYLRLVIVCHRRFGKTYGLLHHGCKFASECKKKRPRIAYVAPFFNQAKEIAWEYLKEFSQYYPNSKINNSDFYVEFESKHKGSAGARIYIIGADKPQRLRGVYWDMVILDEYAQIKPELWGEVIAPALADRQGQAIFVGTPRGQNSFYAKYLEACRKERWFAYLCTVEQSGVFDAEAIKDLKEDMTDIEFAQEFMCDFTVSAQNILIPGQTVDEAMHREISPKAVENSPMILGVDVARFGDDRTVIFPRQGQWVDKPRIYKGLNIMETADRVMMAMRDYHADVAYIDCGGLGAGVVDRVRQLGWSNAMEVNFGQKPLDTDTYENLRAEMYFKLRDFLQVGGGCLPQLPDLRQELDVTEYKFSKTGKYLISPKDEIKEKLGKSPDIADALALTFAKPFVKPSRYANDYIQEDTYDPLKDY